jgi:hypothetical protein
MISTASNASPMNTNRPTFDSKRDFSIPAKLANQGGQRQRQLAENSRAGSEAILREKRVAGAAGFPKKNANWV